MAKPLRTILLMLIALNAKPLLAQMGDYERTKLLEVMNASAVQENTDYFNGHEFNPNANIDDALNYMNAYTKGVNKAVQVVNGLSSPARNSDEGRELVNRVREKIEYSKAMTNRFRAFEREKKALAARQQSESESPAQTHTQPPKVADQQMNEVFAPIQNLLTGLSELLDNGTFDGEDFSISVSAEIANKYNQDFFNALNAAISEYNALPAQLKNSSQAKSTLEQISRYQSTARKLNGALANHRVALQRAAMEQRENAKQQAAAAQQTLRPQCDHMRQRIIDPNRHITEIVLRVSTAAETGGWNTAHNTPIFQQLTSNMANTLSQVAQNCSAEAYAEVMNSGEHCEDSKIKDPVTWCQVANAYTLAREQADARDAARQAARPAACDLFAESVMTRRHKRHMQQLLEDPTASSMMLPDISKLLKTTDKIKEACSEPQFASISASACATSPMDDAGSWCAAANSARDTFRKRLTRPLASWETLAEARYDNADELQQRDGWVRVEGPTTLAHTLSFERMMTVNLADFPPEEQLALFRELNIQPEDFPYFANTTEFIDELQDAIHEGASDWGTLQRATGGQEADYGKQLAAAQITSKWHADAQIHDAWYSRGSWKIHKNNIGVILRRTLPGYVMFKLPADPYCQVRSFTLTEQYTGTATFQKAKGVRFGYVRFQDCESS